LNWKNNSFHRSLLVLLVVLSTLFGTSNRFQKFNPFKSFPASETISFSESVIDSDGLQDFQEGDALISLSYDISLKHIKIAYFNSGINFADLQVSFHFLPRSPPSA